MEVPLIVEGIRLSVMPNSIDVLIKEERSSSVQCPNIGGEY